MYLLFVENIIVIENNTSGELSAATAAAAAPSLDDLSAAGALRIKLTGFGNAASVDRKQLETSVGLPDYIAPEILGGNVSFTNAKKNHAKGLRAISLRLRNEKNYETSHFFVVAVRS